MCWADGWWGSGDGVWGKGSEWNGEGWGWWVGGAVRADNVDGQTTTSNWKLPSFTPLRAPHHSGKANTKVIIIYSSLDISNRKLSNGFVNFRVCDLICFFLWLCKTANYPRHTWCYTVSDGRLICVFECVRFDLVCFFLWFMHLRRTWCYTASDGRLICVFGCVRCDSICIFWLCIVDAAVVNQLITQYPPDGRNVFSGAVDSL